MSLYLKYRSQTRDDLVEQDYVKQILKTQIQKIHDAGASSERNLSNFIFFGPRGIGKTSIARILARSLCCTDLQDTNPCNACDACKSILANKAMDVIEIDAASHTGVDNVREEIISKAVYPPSSLRKKIYIIDEVHMLSKGAFNALLKIMEEPPEYLIFILATTDIHKVPETIMSRCQIFNFKKITRTGIQSRLRYICDQEGFRYDDEAIDMISKMADGGMRDAVKYLDQVSNLGDVTADNISKFLGVAPAHLVVDFVNKYTQSDISDIYTYIDQLIDQGIDISNFLKSMTTYIDEQVSAEGNIAGLFDIVDIISAYFESIRYYPYPALVLKNIIFKNKGGKNNLEQKKISVQKENNPSKLARKEEKKAVEKIEAKEDVPVKVDGGHQNIAISQDIVSNQEANTSAEYQNSKTKTNIDMQYNLEDIKSKIISQSGSVVGAILGQYCNITKIENHIVYIGVISSGQMTMLSMKKADTDKIIKQILGDEYKLEYHILDKDSLLDDL